MANTHNSRKDQYTSSKAVVCGVEYCELQSVLRLARLWATCYYFLSVYAVQSSERAWRLLSPVASPTFRTRKKVIDLHFPASWSVAYYTSPPNFNCRHVPITSMGCNVWSGHFCKCFPELRQIFWTNPLCIIFFSAYATPQHHHILITIACPLTSATTSLLSNAKKWRSLVFSILRAWQTCH